MMGMSFSMRQWVVNFFLAGSIFSASLSADEIKQRISHEIELLKKTQTSEEKSGSLYRLALAYSEDQEIERAFVSFLDALSNAPRLLCPPLCEDEKVIYEEALSDYLSQGAIDPYKTAQNLIEKYSQEASLHPEYLHLNFLLSVSYANIGHFENFLKKFFYSYPYLSDHFLAYKTQGILFIRLSQIAKTHEEKDQQLAHAFDFLHKAWEKNPTDPSLYKMLVNLSKVKKEEANILRYLQMMVTKEVAIPRSDIYGMVKEAVELEEYELGQEMIDQAKRHFTVSKAITAAQEYLNQHKGG